MISFKCPSCKQRLQLEDGNSGQEIRCTWCGKWTTIPSRLSLMLRNPRKLFVALLYVLVMAALLLITVSAAFRRR